MIIPENPICGYPGRVCHGLKKVILESPFRASEYRSQDDHELYLQHCIADSLSRGETPFASHLYFTRVLNDDIPRERAIGIEAAWPWAEHADLIAAYTDLGLSEGMKTSLAHYEAIGKRIEWRRLDVMLFQRVFLNAA